MSDTDLNDDVSEETENANLRHLREKAAEADELRAKLAERERRDAIRDAGIDLDSEAGKLLLETAGLDIEKVKALLPAETPAADLVSDEEKALTAERQAVATGAEVETSKPMENPYGKPMYGAYDKAKAAGKTTAGAVADAVASIREAAAKGDTRVIYDPSNPSKRYS